LFIKISAWFGNTGHPSSVLRHPTFFNQYEAAQSGRRFRLWQPGSAMPQCGPLGKLTNLGTRSHDATRNNAGSRMARAIVCQTKSAFGIMPKSLANGALDLYGVLRWVRERSGCGWIFIRLRIV
jgi:hypothetical protein